MRGHLATALAAASPTHTGTPAPCEAASLAKACGQSVQYTEASLEPKKKRKLPESPGQSVT